MRSVGIAVASYLAENSDYFPPSYYYPTANGTFDPYNQDPTHPNGYAHWSSFLFDFNKDLRSFTCPEFPKGGLSRTNPGTNPNNWTDGQTDQNANSSPAAASVEDKQAPVMAFTANAAILPRNKFTAAVASADGGNGQRLNIFVKRVSVAAQGQTIMMTEFNTNWRAITAAENGNGVGGGSTLVIKGHRPLNPFYNLGGGTDEYNSVPSHGFFLPTDVSSLYDKQTLSSAETSQSLITDPQSQLNAVGRNHPGNFSVNGKSYGGSSNFLYVDGHVERKSVANTVARGNDVSHWEWGRRYYSINGDNEVQVAGHSIGE